MKYRLPLFLILLLAAPAAVYGSELARRFEQEHVLPLITDAPGGALVVVDNGRVVLQRVYGVTDLSSRKPVTEQTLFRIASLSKTFASAAAALLTQETAVAWHTPLKANLDHLKFKNESWGSQINLQHILSQSTGLMPHAYTNLIEERMSYERILDRLDRVDFVCKPGQCYSYQNVVFSLVGDLVESETRMEYPAYVDSRLFKPLGMKRASIGFDEFVSDANHARPHVWNGKTWRAVKPTAHYYKVSPAAGVNASIGDLREWLLAQLGQKPDVIPGQLLEQMHTGVIRTSRLQAHYPRRKQLGDVYYGLGWRVFDYGDLEGFVHHGGYVKGMCSTMVLHKASQSGMVFLTNAELRGMNELVLDFAALRAADEKAGLQLASKSGVSAAE